MSPKQLRCVRTALSLIDTRASFVAWTMGMPGFVTWSCG